MNASPTVVVEVYQILTYFVIVHVSCLIFVAYLVHKVIGAKSLLQEIGFAKREESK